MKKRYLVIGLCVLILVLSLVTACGGKNETTMAISTATVIPTATTTPTLAKTSTPTATAKANTIGDILNLEASITSVKYDMITTMSLTNLFIAHDLTITQEETIQATVYMKNNNKFREDVSFQCVNTRMLLDLDTGIMYTYIIDQNMVIKTKLDPSQIPQGAMKDPNSVLQYNPQIQGKETIDGKSCIIITWNIPGSGTMKEWIWTDKGFPIKTEMTTSQGTTTVEFKNIDFSNIPDSIFELPSGVQIMTI